MPKNKKIEAWALVSESENIPNKFDSAHNVFSPRIYSTKEGAERVAEVVVTGGARLKVVPCEIIFLTSKK